jgi:hypothetical protein
MLTHEGMVVLMGIEDVVREVVDVVAVVVEEPDKLELVEVKELEVEASQVPKPAWQPAPQYASVEPLNAVSNCIYKTRDIYHQPYWLQQFPHWEPKQVCPLPLEAHWPFFVTVRLEEGEAEVGVEEVAVEVVVVENVVKALQEP